MEIFGKDKEMTDPRKVNYLITVVLTAFVLSLFAVGVTYAARPNRPSLPARQSKES